MVDRVDGGSSPAEGAEPDLLAGWKAVARHLRVSVRTVQRWERYEGLPVRRHMHDVAGSVYASCAELDAWWNSRPAPVAPRPPRAGRVRSIAVLPFSDLDRRLDTEILADGLTEEVISALANIQGLKVVARTSVFRFKNRHDDVREIADRLGVEAVLEGSVRRHGDRVRVVAQLIDTSTGCHLWSERFDHETRDLFALQDDLAHAISGALRPSVAAAAPSPASRSPRRADAYEHFLEGRSHWNKRTPAGFLKAVESFERAVDIDPGMAAGWAALAQCYAMAPAFSTMTEDETDTRARAAVERALDLDPRLAEAHVTLGFIRANHDFEWAAAERQFLAVLDQAPGLAFAHLLYAGVVLAPMGRLAEAEAEQARAIDLDPLSSLAIDASGMLALMQRRYDAAEEAFRAALAFDAQLPWARRGLGEVLLLEGRYAEAEQELAMVEMPALAAGLLGFAQANLGRIRDAERLLDRLERLNQPAVSWQVAVLRLGLGDRDGSLEWLARAVADRGVGVIWVKVDPILDPLRGDPRFAAILSAMNLQ